jgi:multiple sugar transport system substrate-binding protein
MGVLLVSPLKKRRTEPMRNEPIDALVAEAVRLRYSRRTALKRAAALGLSVPAVAHALGSAGAAPGPRRFDRAPAFIQGTSLHVLAASYFVPDGQTLHQQQLEDWGAENNVSVSIDFVNWPDLQPRITTAAEAGNGPDIIEFWDAWPALYAPAIADLSALATSVGNDQGGYYDWVVKSASVGGTLMTVPHGVVAPGLVYRISYLERAGILDPINNFPQTWEDFFKVAKTLKANGKPVGQGLGHSLGDAPGFAYPFMWSYGAMEVETDGRTVAFNKPQFVDGMKLFVQAWKDGFDETGLSWDDTVNNRAFLSDQISATLNGSSIYLEAVKAAGGGNPGTNSNVVVDPADIHHTLLPEGPAGRFNLLGSRSYAVMSYSNNIAGATAFLEWWFQKDQFQAWLESQQGYQIPPAPKFASLPIYFADPKLVAYADVANYGRNKGYAGTSGLASAEVSARNIIVNAFAEAVQDGDAQGAVDRAARQLERIYGA